MKFEGIKSIFFDLDDTLYDHTRAEQATLKTIFESNQNLFEQVQLETFLLTYARHNKILWEKMAEGEITAAELKILRLKNTFEELSLVQTDVEKLSQEYLRIYLQQHFAFPNIQETLFYLKRKFLIGILTNGFVDIQEHKLRKLGLESFFDYKVYSSDVGVMKPDRRIFEAARELSNSDPGETVYIGDSYKTDIIGAKDAGWQTIWFNPRGVASNDHVDAEIKNLIQLKELF